MTQTGLEKVSDLSTRPPWRRVVVTGGAGHFGRMVLQRLLEHHTVSSVVSLDIRPSGLEHPKLEDLEADVRDPEISRLLEGADTLVHLAFLITDHRPRERYESINIEGSKNVFRAAAKAGTRQIIYASSIAAYGLVRHHPVPIVETTPRVHQPDFSYNDAKFRVEAFLDHFEDEHPELVVTRLRMASALGAGHEGAIAKALARGYIPYTSNVPWPIVWDEDVADGLVKAFEKRAAGAFNLAADEPMSAPQLAKATGMSALWIPRWFGVCVASLAIFLASLGLGHSTDPAWFKYSDAVLILSSEKARKELGWKRRCNTALEVIQRAREWYASTAQGTRP